MSDSGSHGHAFEDFNPRVREGLTVVSRRGMLKTSLAGLAGLSLPALLQAESQGTSRHTGKSVILLWMAGGPSHIDTWDPKPDRPLINRGPFGVTQTKLPGVLISEHLPKHAGTNHAAMPPYVAFMKSRSHLAFAGYLGKRYDPFIGDRVADLPRLDLVGKPIGRNQVSDLFRLPAGLDQRRLYDRRTLLKDIDRLRSGLDRSGSMEAMDEYRRQAVELVIGGRARDAFDLSKEPAKTRDRYGKHLWCQQALLARRLVEAGSRFVTLDLSYHTASGTWDTHGDNIPPDGRNHWPEVMSMVLAGGGMRHGQVIGSTERDGGHIRSRPVTPGDLAATIYRHVGVPLDTTYEDPRGRPNNIVIDGRPIAELL